MKSARLLGDLLAAPHALRKPLGGRAEAIGELRRSCVGASTPMFPLDAKRALRGERLGRKPTFARAKLQSVMSVGLVVAQCFLH